MTLERLWQRFEDFLSEKGLSFPFEISIGTVPGLVEIKVRAKHYDQYQFDLQDFDDYIFMERPANIQIKIVRESVAEIEITKVNDFK